jgi:hypothetical protein
MCHVNDCELDCVYYSMTMLLLIQLVVFCLRLSPSKQSEEQQPTSLTRRVLFNISLTPDFYCFFFLFLSFQVSVHFKFKSQTTFDSIQFDGAHISVGDLKRAIVAKKKLGYTSDFDLKFTNAQSGEGALNVASLFVFVFVFFFFFFFFFFLIIRPSQSEYKHESMFIPKNTALIVQRIPGQRTRPILSAPIVESKPTDAAAAVAASIASSTSSSTTAASNNGTSNGGARSRPNASTAPVSTSTPSVLAFTSDQANVADGSSAAAVAGINEQERIQSLLVDAASNNYRPAPGERPHFGGGRGGGQHKRFTMRGDGSGVPPPAYTCHRCGQTGHYIQQCPTNADPQYTHKRVKAAIGIPTSALELVPLEEGATLPEGSQVMMINGKLAVYKPNEDAFKAALASAGVDRG